MSQYIGELFALITAFLWSGSSFAFSAASLRVGAIQLNINRMILASVFLIVTILLAGVNYEVNSNQIFYLIISSIIGLVIGDSFLFYAYTEIGARLSMLLMTLSPALSAITAYLIIDERLSPLAVLGMIVTVSGVTLVVSEKKNNSNSKFQLTRKGFIYGVIGAAGQAVGLVFAKMAFQAGSLNGFVATFIRVFSAVIILLPIASLFRIYKNPFIIYKNDLKALALTLTGTTLGPYLGITFSLFAVEYAKVGIASTLMSTMPIIMLPMSKILHKEKLSLRTVIGSVIAVAGVAILFMR